MSRLALFLSFLVLVPALARAQAVDPASLSEDERKGKAAQYYQDAQSAFDDERYDEAVTLFRMADRMMPAAVIDFNIAKAFERQSRYEDAIRAYESYLKRYQDANGVLPPDGLDVQKNVAFLKQLTRKELPEVVIESDPPGANVYLNDPDRAKILGQTPYTARLAKGAYEVALVADGFASLAKTIDVSAEAPAKFLFKLEKIINVGTLDVTVNVKGARIYLDGKVVGLSPLPPAKVEPGERQVVVEKDTYTTYRAMAKVTTNQTTEVTATLYLEDPPSSWRSYVGWPLVSLGVLGLGAGIAFWQLADKEYNTTDTFKQYQLFQNLGYGLGGGLVGAGFGFLIWEWARDAINEGDALSQGNGLYLLPTAGGITFGGGF
jgi:tetratricopeptide (TPR) repeat protein